MRRAKAALKELVGAVALAPGLAVRTRTALRRRINVVYAHRIGDWVPYDADFYTGLTLERFDRSLRLLASRFAFVPLPELLGDEPPDDGPPRLSVTFDDGFDVGEGMADVLEANGVKATTFVVTETLGNRNLMWRNKLSALRALRPEEVYVARFNDLATKSGFAPIADGRSLMAATTAWPMARKEDLVDELWSACAMPPLSEFLDEHRPYFTWPALERWLARGHHVGLHTATHPFCSRIDAPGIVDEVVDPAAALRERLNLSFLPLSYPFGDRLDVATERELVERGVVDAAFGIAGFARRGAPRHSLERACIDASLRFEVFGKALLGRPRAAHD